jgi:CheY-like chemotaxis protein
LGDRGPTLLVIEDTQDQALLLGVAARHALPGLEVETAYHGLDGLAYLQDCAPFAEKPTRATPDLVILDLLMPELDGFGVLEWIQERQNPLPFPVVVLTASPKAEDEARALELGAVAVHQKPSDLPALVEAVQSIVHRWIGRSQIIGAHLWSMG